MMSESLWAVFALIVSLMLQGGVDLRVTPQAPPAAAAAPAPAFDPALYEQGKQVYLSQYCGVCHVLAAAGTAGVFGPAHDGVGRIAGERIAEPRYAGAATTAEAYLRESILEPGAYIVSGGIARQAMPSFAHLPAADIDALVYFLMQQQ
jgi:mono/diheme cytochrome c family protein